MPTVPVLIVHSEKALTPDLAHAFYRGSSQRRHISW
jgi:hypothetical protein